MNRTARLVTVLAVAAALLSTAGCNKLKARDQLNKGVQSFRSANYEEAIGHFQNAVNLDKDLKVAKMYLATAYAQQYVPGVETPENLRNAQLAIDEYKQVLASDPHNVTSLKGIAFLYMQRAAINVRKDSHRGNAHFTAGPHDANGDFTSICNEYLGEHSGNPDCNNRLRCARGLRACLLAAQ